MKEIQQIIRYLIGGGSTAVINWSLVYCFVEYFNFHYLTSMNSAIAIIYFYSYLINKYFVFRNYASSHLKHGTGFIIMRLLLLATINVVVYIGVDILKLNYMFIIVITTLGEAVVSFLIMKFVLFKATAVTEEVSSLG